MLTGKMYVNLPFRKNMNPDSESEDNNQVMYDFLVCAVNTDEWRSFSSEIKGKPLFGFITESASGAGFYSNNPLHRLSVITEGPLVIIPLGHADQRFNYGDYPNQYGSYISSGTMIKGGFLFDCKSPDGFMDTSIIEDPLAVFRGNSFVLKPGEILNQSEIADILWKVKNRVKVVSMYSSRKSSNDRLVYGLDIKQPE